MAMKISEAVESSNEFIEVNEKNKDECKQCENRVALTRQNVAASQNNVNAMQAAYDRAVAQRARAAASASDSENAEESRAQLDALDAQVEEARISLEKSQAQLENARYFAELASSELLEAQRKLEESKGELEGLEQELEQIQLDYTSQQSLISSLQGMMFSGNIVGVMDQFSKQASLAANTRQRILASLGKSGSSTYSDSGVSSGGYGMGGRVKSSYTSTSIDYGGGYDDIGSSESVGAYSQRANSTSSGVSSQLTPMQALTQYMNSHNYSADDYATYALDPEWQRLHQAAFPSHYNSAASAIKSMPKGNFGHIDAHPSEFREGMYTFTGTGHDNFVKMMSSPDSYSFEDLGDGFITTIDPSLIEGVNISDHEFRNPEGPGGFWTHHNKEGSEESFLEVASRIPEVQRLIDRGVSISDIRNDERLGNTARIYFDPSDSQFVTVYEGDGYYEFVSNGRHRILAARMLGYNIPVRVRGRRTRRN